MRAAIYVRVSTEEQGSEGHSLESQEAACRQYAEVKGLEVLRVLSDDVSGSTLERPGLTELRGLCGRSEVGAVIVYTAHRLSRNQYDALTLRREFRRQGIELHIATRGVEENSAAGKILSGVEGIFAEYWLDHIREAASRGRRAKVLRGEVSVTTAPFGYEIRADKTAAIVEAEADVVRLIYDLHEHGLSLTAISDDLDRRGILTPAARGRAPSAFPSKKSSTRWSETSLRNILTTPTYAGRWAFRKSRRDEDGRKIALPESERLTVEVPAIVTLEQQAAAIDRLKRSNSRRKGKPETYLLSGMLRCGVCGMGWAGFHSEQGGKVYRYYRCSGKLKKNELRNGERRCSLKPIPADRIEDSVWRQMCFPSRLAREARKAVEEIERGDAPARDLVAKLDRRLAENGTERQRLLDLYQRVNGPTMTDVLQRLEALDRERQALEKDRLTASKQLQRTFVTPGTNEELELLVSVLLERAKVDVARATAEDKRRLFEQIGLSGTVNLLGRQPVVEFTARFPMLLPGVTAEDWARLDQLKREALVTQEQDGVSSLG